MVTSVASSWTTGGLKSEDSLFALTPLPPISKTHHPSPDKHKSFQSPNHDMAVCCSAYTKSYMKHRPLRFVFIRESSFNMTRGGDEDIEGGSENF